MRAVDVKNFTTFHDAATWTTERCESCRFFAALFAVMTDGGTVNEFRDVNNDGTCDACLYMN
jgi:hypothetical protein